MLETVLFYILDIQLDIQLKNQNLLLNYKANIFSVDIEQKHLIKTILRLDIINIQYFFSEFVCILSLRNK